MKSLKIFLTLLITCFSIFTFAGCQKSNPLDAAVYCLPEISYKTYGDKDSYTANLADIIGNNLLPQNYDTIQITTNKSWTYGMILEMVEFDVILSSEANMDIDITISHLEHGENYNATSDTYYFYKTVSITKETTKVSLVINDNFINKDATISIEVVDSCYTANPNLTFTIANFKMFGHHEATNY